MVDTIRILIGQATVDSPVNFLNTDGKVVSTYNERKLDIELLVKLTVEECLGFVMPFEGSGDPEDVALRSARRRMLEHFGMKE